MLKAFLGFLKFLFVLFMVIVIFLAGIVVGSVLEQVNTQAKIDEAVTFCEFQRSTEKTISDSWKNVAEGAVAIAAIMKKQNDACQAARNKY